MKSEPNPWTMSDWSIPEEEWNNSSLPMVTLGVLNYNRQVELRQTLDVLTRATQYSNYEIIVVDNGSTDGSIEMVISEYPHVRLHEVGLNAGTSSRNYLFRAAKGKYLFSFDDDSFPGTPATILRIVQYMESHSNIDVLSSACFRPIGGWFENEGWEAFRIRELRDDGFEGIYIVEGGVCFRTNSIKEGIGYDPTFFYGTEGMDLGLQLYNQGICIAFCPRFVTLHFPIDGRVRGSRIYGNARNTIWMVAKHWPLHLASFLLPMIVIRKFIGVILHPRRLSNTLKGILDGFLGISKYIKYSPKLSSLQIRRLGRFYGELYRW
jgi:GT2 family glycosyltransferase